MPQETYVQLGAPAPTPGPKRVTARVVVAVNADGKWQAFGGDEHTDAAAESEVADRLDGPQIALHYVEIDLPVPAPRVHRVRVEDAP